MLIDDVTITIKAGDGGNGSAHFKRNAQTAKGGPDGGNGGNGGNLFVAPVNDILGLREFQYKKEIKAEDGVKGGKQNLYGRNGKDTTIFVPIGSTITDLDTGESWDIEDQTQPILLAKGGNGGRGNNEFKTATNQTPTFAEPGEPGQLRKIHIVLRLIADIGFIGLPNAGKSSLLKALTHAHPKIANYPFTTLEPNIGVLPDATKSNGEKIVLADIPGLIEGASKGKGLGIKFLKHVEKTKVLFHCIDSTDEDIAQTYQTVRKELEEYSEILANKKEIILLTKTDLITSEELKKKKESLKTLKKEILTISIYEENSLNQVKETILQLVSS